MAQTAIHVSELAPCRAVAVAELSRLTGGTTLDVLHEAKQDHCRIWVAMLEERGPPLAYVLCWLVADELQVVDLATHPQTRRRGLARALIRTLVGFARQHGIVSLWIEVRCTNAAAIALYENNGFKLVRRRPRYYDDGTDALEMAHFIAEHLDQ